MSGATATLQALWEAAESAHAGRTALVSHGVRLTYAETGARIRALAAALIARGGVRPGEAVALLLPNGAEFVIAYFAVTGAGAMVAPLDDRLLATEVEALLRDSEAAGVIVHEALLSRLPRLREGLPALRWILVVGAPPAGCERWDDWSAEPRFGSVTGPLPAQTPDGIAELMYTSGTTAEPKPVLRSHRNVRAAVRNSIAGFGYRGGDTILIVMPMSHSSALNSQMLPLLELGGTLVIHDRFAAPTVLETIGAERVTCMRAVPSMIKAMLTHDEFREESLPTLRLIVNSSAAIDPGTLVALKHRFEHIEVMNSYGLTEASTCTVLPDAEALRRPESIGRAIDGVAMTLLDAAGAPVADGDEGEICVAGDHVFAAYRKRPGLREQVVRGGWLHSGDLAHRDADGYYYLHGRQDDVIECGGRKFAPPEVESVIAALDGVAEAAVAGMPHRMLGQVAKAFVVPRPGATVAPRAVIRHCQARLASWKVPFAVEIVPSLPRNSLGKLLRRQLLETAASPVERAGRGA